MIVPIKHFLWTFFDSFFHFCSTRPLWMLLLLYYYPEISFLLNEHVLIVSFTSWESSLLTRKPLSRQVDLRALQITQGPPVTTEDDRGSTAEGTTIQFMLHYFSHHSSNWTAEEWTVEARSIRHPFPCHLFIYPPNNSRSKSCPSSVKSNHFSG